MLITSILVYALAMSSTEAMSKSELSNLLTKTMENNRATFSVLRDINTLDVDWTSQTDQVKEALKNFTTIPIFAPMMAAAGVPLDGPQQLNQDLAQGYSHLTSQAKSIPVKECRGKSFSQHLNELNDLFYLYNLTIVSPTEDTYDNFIDACKRYELPLRARWYTDFVAKATKGSEDPQKVFEANVFGVNLIQYTLLLTAGFGGARYRSKLSDEWHKQFQERIVNEVVDKLKDAMQGAKGFYEEVDAYGDKSLTFKNAIETLGSMVNSWNVERIKELAMPVLKNAYPYRKWLLLFGHPAENKNGTLIESKPTSSSGLNRNGHSGQKNSFVKTVTTSEGIRMYVTSPDENIPFEWREKAEKCLLGVTGTNAERCEKIRECASKASLSFSYICCDIYKDLSVLQSAKGAVHSQVESKQGQLDVSFILY